MKPPKLTMAAMMERLKNAKHSDDDDHETGIEDSADVARFRELAEKEAAKKESK